MREIDLHVQFESLETLGFDFVREESRDADVRGITLVACTEQGSVATITYSEPVDDTLAASDAIMWWERLEQTGPNTTYLCKAVPTDPPRETFETEKQSIGAQAVTVEDQGCTVTFVGSQEALQSNSALIDGSESPFSLRRLTDYEGPRDELESLTRRQREVLETAYEHGYYEVPRETTAAEIARRLELERATVTEHLQRAERNLLSTILAD